jgi:hypothetical protein
MRKLYTLLFLLSWFYTSAQPSLNAANINPYVGLDVVTHLFTPTSLVPSTAGANQTWDFSTTPSQSVLSFTYTTPAATPYGASFPTANLANDQNGVYEYQIANPSYFARAGAWANGAPIAYSDEQKFLVYPFTFNDTFTDNFAATFTISGFTFNRSGSITATADGYGTIILPWGTLTDVLRVHYTEDYQDVYAFGTIIYSSDNYAWYKPGTHYFIYSLSAATSNGTTGYSGSYLDPVSLGIQDQSVSAMSLQVFPNPADDHIEVNFTTEHPGTYRVTILNALGEEVLNFAELKNATRSVIYNVDISTLSNGIYNLVVNAEGNNYSKKFVVQEN